MGTLKPQSNGPLYSSMVIGTVAVDGWAVSILYSEEYLTLIHIFHLTLNDGTVRSPSLLYQISPPINGQCTNLYYLMWHYNLITFALKGVN